MIKHVICIKLKDKKDAPQAKEVLLSMQGKVPQIRSIEVGIDVLMSDRSYDVILIVMLDSLKALEDYQKDAYHCDVVKKYIHEVRVSSVAVDYEV